MIVLLTHVVNDDKSCTSLASSIKGTVKCYGKLIQPSLRRNAHYKLLVPFLSRVASHKE